MISIRRATPLDLGWLCDQLTQFAQFFGSERSLFPKDMNAVHAQLLEMMHPRVGCFYIATRCCESSDPSCLLGGTDDCRRAERLGFIAGALHPHLYNRSITQLTELFWWVAPEHRGTSAGARLLNAFMDYGHKHADWIVMTLEAKSPIDPRSLAKRGFRPQETSYLLEVER